MRGAVKTVLLAGAIMCFIVAVVVSSNPGDWLAIGLIFLTGSQFTDIRDLDFSRPPGKG
jgi:hypothetical protein